MGAPRTRVGLLCAVPLVAVFTLGSAHAQPSHEGTAAEPIFQQLEAFRRNDYERAYAFASAEIRRLFDLRAFERMVRRGYPELAASTRARVIETRLGPDGHTYIRLKIRGANAQHIEAVYEMIQEGGGWKINGVTTRPDPGEEV